MKEEETIGISRRRLFEMAGISAGAALVAGLPAFAGKSASSEKTTAGAVPMPEASGAAADDTSIRPFHIHFPEADLVDLRRRIVATRWPEKETVADTSQGVQLATMQKLAHYWATDYDWRKVRGEAERPAAIRHHD